MGTWRAAAGSLLVARDPLATAVAADRAYSCAGERILSIAPPMRGIARLVRSTHERYDGSGYPDGLAGEEIPLGARIIAVCDAFETITSGRQRPAVTVDEALEELRRCAGTQFDPLVVDAFIAEHGPHAAAPDQPSGAVAQPARSPLLWARPGRQRARHGSPRVSRLCA